jgi:Fe-S-cluster containining protein
MAGQKKAGARRKNRKSGNGAVCRECNALCCRDLAMMTTRPRTRDEIDDLKWHLHYDTVNVCIRNHRWYIVVKGKCIYLSRNNLCKIYDRRPEKCRRHNAPECERFGSWYDLLIETPEGLERYLREGRKR